MCQGCGFDPQSGPINECINKWNNKKLMFWVQNLHYVLKVTELINEAY